MRPVSPLARPWSVSRDAIARARASGKAARQARPSEVSSIGTRWPETTCLSDGRGL